MCDSLHDISSDISPQSSSRSQPQARGIHRPFWQENWSAWQGWAEKEKRSHLIQSHVHKSLQDLHNNSNDHYITGMSVSAQCKLFITQSHSTARKVWRPWEMCCCLTGRQLHAARPWWTHMDSAQVMSCWCGICMSIWRWGNIHHPLTNAHWLIL